MQIIRTTSREEALTGASTNLNSLFEQAGPLPILFLTSGSSAFQLLDKINPQYLQPTVTISVLDERYSSDPAINNFAQLEQSAFFNNAKNAGCHFIDTKVRNEETGQQHADRFQKAITDWKENNPTGKIIATVGMGVDGHTSGVMPYTEDPELFQKIFNNHDWVVYYDAGNKNPFPLRTTTTLSFMRTQIDSSVFFIAGQEKKEAFDRLLKKEGTLAETPARIVHEMKNTIIVTDIP